MQNLKIPNEYRCSKTPQFKNRNFGFKFQSSTKARPSDSLGPKTSSLAWTVLYQVLKPSSRLARMALHKRQLQEQTKRSGQTREGEAGKHYERGSRDVTIPRDPLGTGEWNESSNIQNESDYLGEDLFLAVDPEEDAPRNIKERVENNPDKPISIFNAFQSLMENIPEIVWDS
ncbi:hypothetical protein BDQ17DRAFT_1328011 [Cyathus striatus]|nr:hypothetical protein BDQ17DRAFT_1328011 [Cyathus striatus]